MRHPLGTIIPLSAALLLGSLAKPARAATMILHSFTGGVGDGRDPEGSLTLSGSKLYGMTSDGGAGSDGVVFSMNTDGTGFGLLHSFTGGASDGLDPKGSLTLSGSKLYGMTTYDGNDDGGVVFTVNTDGTGYSLLHRFTSSFSDGGYPYGSLTLSGSKLFGMTTTGGSRANGVIFSMNIDGTGFSLLHNFMYDINDGAGPLGSLTLSGSKLFGMASGGGGSGNGVIFSINTDGTGFGLLHSFAGGSDGAYPHGSLTLSGSKLYGMTTAGGVSDKGVLFSVNTDGTAYGLLHNFAGGVSDGASPNGSLTLSGSTLFGMTNVGGSSGNGVLFSMNTDGTGYGLLDSFKGTLTDGAHPNFGDLTLSGDGLTLYGMTSEGGIENRGVVFSRAVPEPGSFALLGLGAFLLSSRRQNART